MTLALGQRMAGQTAATGSAEDALKRIANIAHHGGLMGMDAFTAVTEIRKISLPWWDRDDCSRLQKPNNTDESRTAPVRTPQSAGSAGGGQ